jgi:RND family efflux transporter MFP subunit
MKKVVGLTLMSVMSVALCSCGGGGKGAQKAEVADVVVEVKGEVGRKQSVEQIREYTGTISPYSKNMISSQSATRIDQIKVEVGDHVKAGQLLVKMEETSYLQSKLQLENLKADFERAMSLYSTGGISKQQIDQLKTQIDVAQETFDNLEKNTRLLSPINGVVTQRNFDNGDVTGGQPILQVQQLQPVKILINVQEEFFAHVNTNMKADVKIDVYSDVVFTGKINLVYPTIDNMTHTFTTEILLQNANLKVRPGMFARVVLNFGKKEHVVIPDKAVIKQQGTDERFVYVILPNSTVERRTIVLGQRLRDAYEVISGVSDGEKVVTAGISKLINGARVVETAGI